MWRNSILGAKTVFDLHRRMSRSARSKRFQRSMAAARRAGWISILIGALFGGAMFLGDLLLSVPRWRAEARGITDVKDRVLAENEIVKNVLQSLGGVVVIIGLYFTWRNLRLTHEGQITDRFNQAVEHLGADRVEVRLGGIFALARIARDSAKDYWAVMQVLSAYVRESGRGDNQTAVAVEIQAILTLLATRELEYEPADMVIDLSGADLRQVNLRNASLDGFHLDDVNLEHADLSGARLQAAFLRNAKLHSAQLRGADLSAANLTSADLRDASLRDAKLVSANLFGARFEGTTLVGADLSSAQNMTRRQVASAIVDERTILPHFKSVTDPE
jgi:hypothetical protein